MSHLRFASLVLALALTGPAWAFDPASLSKDAEPCADFDAFVNGPWLADTTLPGDRSVVTSFTALRIANAGLQPAKMVVVDRPR